jgi:2-methylcitrate dehydratase PrpD
MAALLAREGFTGPETILEGEFGFLHGYTSRPDPNKILENWATPHEVMKASIKPHSCCRYKQGPIDGILQVMRENALTAEDVEAVTLGILKAGFSLVVEPEDKKSNPKSVVDAQFSMPFGAAVAMLYGKATLDEYTLDNIRSSKVREMMGRVVCKSDQDLEKEFPQKWPASVVLKTKNGTRFSVKIEYPKGDPENPLSWDELIAKFQGLTEPVFQNDRTYQIIDRVRVLEKMGDISALASLLAV